MMKLFYTDMHNIPIMLGYNNYDEIGCQIGLCAFRNVYIFQIQGEGVYPQSNKSLAIVDIDASKGIIDLWVHFFVAIEDIHRN